MGTATFVETVKQRTYIHAMFQRPIFGFWSDREAARLSDIEARVRDLELRVGRLEPQHKTLADRPGRLDAALASLGRAVAREEAARARK